MLWSMKRLSFFRVSSGFGSVAISGKKIERRPRTSTVVLKGFTALLRRALLFLELAHPEDLLALGLAEPLPPERA